MAATTSATPAPPPTPTAGPAKPKKKNLAIHLLAGGVAGCCEALSCHPLDTIKVRLQLRGERAALAAAASAASAGRDGIAGTASKISRQGFVQTGINIAKREGFLALYKGLGAVISGIVPKMAIRFSSFEAYKGALADKSTGVVSTTGVFIAGLGAGVTESVLVVTPMDVIKIRLQAQRHSMTDPLDIPKYRNAAHCAYVLVKEEGFGALYKGVALTALRQSTNQAANFTVYQSLKKKLHDMQPEMTALPAYQHLAAGFISGACGPLFNAPIDTIKTRIQKSPSKEKGWTRFQNVTMGIIKNEGWMALYKGLTPRVLRVAPGQAITFMVYERVYTWMISMSKAVRVEQAEQVGLGEADKNEV